MSFRRAEGALAALIAIGSLGYAAFASGQTATIEAIQDGYGYAVSDDGNVIVGQARKASGWDQAFRAEAGSPYQYLGSLNDSPDGSTAWGASADGSVVVGQTYFEEYPSWSQRAFRWTKGRNPAMVPLNTGYYPNGESFAYDVSDDGMLIVGQADFAYNNQKVPRAVRWVGTSLRDIGPASDRLSRSIARGVSADGKVIVGQCRLEASDPHAFRWTQEQGMEDLGAVAGFGITAANAVSADGSVIVGYSGPSYDTRAAMWKDGEWTELPNLGSPFGSQAHDVSKNGRIIVGEVGFDAVIWDEQGAHLLMSYLVQHGANLSGWSRLDVAYGCSRDGRIITGRGYRGSEGYRAFRAYLPLPNIEPTVEPIAAQTIECRGEQNFVTLQTEITDGDGDRLKVEWLVNGVVRQTSSAFAPGTATFRYDFPHGESNVRVRVTDYQSPVLEQATTVTVQDTTDPVVTVAATQIVPTNPGLDYATKIKIPKPQVNEACDGDPVLTNDAPTFLPIGRYTVTWTVRDDSGNVGTATQQIVVKDLEKPEVLATPAVSKLVDRGEIYATIAVPKPQVFDNVTASGKVVLKSNARPRYPVGTTLVTWTATDQAGNVGRATTKVTVVNRRPTANAGPNVVVNTKSEKGARVRLSAARSSDPDGHTLRYVWSGRGARFSGAQTPNPVATLKVGVTTVQLTVIDEAGARHTDTVRVTVRLKNAKRRPRGSQANEAFAKASSAAAESVRSGPSSGASAAGYRYAAAADRFGIAAGEFVRWEDGQSERDVLADYAALRYYQAVYGQQATNALLRAYGESGDDGALRAAIEAARGVQAARADLLE